MPKLLHAPVGITLVAEAEGREKEGKGEKVRECCRENIFFPPETFSVGAIPRNERENGRGGWNGRGKLREGKTK